MRVLSAKTCSDASPCSSVGDVVWWRYFTGFRSLFEALGQVKQGQPHGLCGSGCHYLRGMWRQK